MDTGTHAETDSFLCWLNPCEVSGRRHPACWSSFLACQAVASQGCGGRPVGVAPGRYPSCYMVASLLHQSCSQPPQGLLHHRRRQPERKVHLWPRSLPHVERTAVFMVAHELLLAVLLSGCTCFWALCNHHSGIPFLNASF